MRWKLIALVAFGAGYVLGARAGRERYEQIRRYAIQVKDDPRVQQKAHDAAETVKAHAHDAAERAKEHLPGHDDPDASELGSFHAATRL